MRPFSLAMILLELLLMTPSGFAQEVMTNQTVVEMVKAGLSERVIVAKIRTSPTNFDVRTDALIALKKNGVPEKVIEAILSTSATEAYAESSTSGAPHSASLDCLSPEQCPVW